MKLIQTITLSSAQANIEFTSIPQTFTDLVILTSLRTSGTESNSIVTRIRPNSATSGLSTRVLNGSGSGTPSSFSDTNAYAAFQAVSGYTANTFQNGQIYIPNYSSTTTAKSMSVDSVSENNATLARQMIAANLWNSTTAITSLLIIPEFGNFESGTTISLYGILKGSDGITTAS